MFFNSPYNTRAENIQAPPRPSPNIYNQVNHHVIYGDQTNASLTKDHILPED